MRVGIGLGEYYSYSAPTPLQVYLPAASVARSIQLEFVVRSGSDQERRDILRTDRFTKRVQVNAGQALEIEVPILIPQANWGVLDVTASEANGQLIASVSRELRDVTPLTNGQYLVAIYCQERPTCQNVQAQIAFGGSSEANAEINKNRRLATFREPRADWWAYGAAQCVVLAGPIAGFSQAERQALEGYLRSGGVLALVEDQLGDKDFLAAYRHGDLDSVAIRVGRGQLVRLPNVGSVLRIPELPALSSWAGGRFAFMAALAAGQQTGEALLRRTGVWFNFPRLRWLIIWLAIYVVVIGPINFFILRRLKRMEWGWATMCALAALFAAGFYLSGAARRPKNYTLDNATIYWMDGRSPVALEDVAVRVSTPERGDVRLAVNDDVVAIPGTLRSADEPEVEIGASMLNKARSLQGWNMDLGSPTVVQMPMLRWSFEDLGFQGFHSFAGTVHWTSQTKLKNETGMAFREAMLFDFSANKQYALSAIAPGEEIDLAGMKFADIWTPEHAPNNRFGIRIDSTRTDIIPPFSVAEVPYSGFQILNSGQMFAGLSDTPVSGTELEPAAVHRSATALTLVYLGER
ncbi:MAG: hypothetical protein ABSC10_05255 [Candidatus Acidiferrales bacterium]|jgi:hypothetical protein